MIGLKADAFLAFELEVGDTVVVGRTARGERRFVPILGGHVKGAISGHFLPGGGDWQSIAPDGTVEIDAHYAFCTDAGAVVEVRSTGMRASRADGTYFRTSIMLSTADAELSHLNNQLYLTDGERLASAVHLRLYAVS